jgi:hypothetical protein
MSPQAMIVKSGACTSTLKTPLRYVAIGPTSVVESPLTTL